MSPQMEFFRNILASAQSGNEAAITILRDIASRLVTGAPSSELLVIGGFLFRHCAELADIEKNQN